MSQTILLLACSVCLAGVMTACGSSDSGTSTPGTAQGTEGGACFPNGTCMDGLVCLSSLCVDPDSGAGGSGGTGGGHTPGVICGSTTCPVGQACCSGAPQVACGTGDVESDPCYAAHNPTFPSGYVGYDTTCDDDGDCAAGEECCALAGNYVAGLSCYTKTAGSKCAETFGPACRSDADCAAGTHCTGAFEDQPEWKWCQ